MPILLFILILSPVNSWALQDWKNLKVRSINCNKLPGRGRGLINKASTKIQPRDYFSYIRPQLNNFISEFYQGLKVIHPFHNPLIRMKNLINRRGPLNYTKVCQTNKKDCAHVLDQLLLIYADFEEIINELNKLHFFYKSKLYNSEEKTYLYSKSVKVIKNLSDITFEIVNYLENIVVWNDNYRNVDIVNDLSKLETHFDVAYDALVFSPLPDKYNSAYSLFYLNFIKPITAYILQSDNYNLLSCNLESYNFIWNNFNLKFTKEEDKVPIKLEKLYSTMQSRWNYILKKIFIK